MANVYWVGGSGTWNTTTTHWSTTSGGAAGAAIPTATDNAIFDANSGGGTVTLSGSRTCLDLICTGFTGTITGTDALSISGSMTLAITMSGFTVTGTISFIATTTGKTVTTAGFTLTCPINFTGTGGGSWTLQDNFTSTSGSGIGLLAGTLNTNNKTVTISSLSMNNVTTRALILGTSILNIGTSTFGGSLNTMPTNLTISGASSTINLISGTIAAGTSISLTLGKSASIVLGTVNSSGDLSFSSTYTNGYIGNLKISGNSIIQIATGLTLYCDTIVFNSSAGNPIRIKSNTTGTASTLNVTTGPVSGDYLIVQDNTAAGSTPFSAAGHSTNNGNNTNWSFATPITNNGRLLAMF